MDISLARESLTRSWGSGVRVLWIHLGMRYGFIARPDEVFADGLGEWHVAHCLTRSDFAFFSGCQQLKCLRWSQEDKIDISFRGLKQVQAQGGNMVVRTRDEVRGVGSRLRRAVGP